FTTAAPTVQGNTISAPIAAGPAGDYRVAFRIVSSDGHPVTGEITFTLTEAAAGTASGTPTATPGDTGDTGQGAADASQGGLGGWLWAIVGVAAVLVAAAVAIAVRRPRDERESRS